MSSSMDSTYATQRLAAKTREGRFLYELQQGFELSPREAEGILHSAKSILLGEDSTSNSQHLRLGQVRQVLVRLDAPHGRPISQLPAVEVVWTVDAGLEDLEVLGKYGKSALRRVRILRLLDEAIEQRGVATEEDLARALGITTRTIRRELAVLRNEGYVLNTRGRLRGIGRAQSHKARIIGFWLDRLSYSEIALRTRHSYPAIQRYITTFGRVASLCRRGSRAEEIAFLVGISISLVHQYIELLERYSDEAHQQRLDELTEVVHTEDIKGEGDNAKKGALK